MGLRNACSLDPEHSGCILVGERGEALISIRITIGLSGRLAVQGAAAAAARRVLGLQWHAHSIQRRLQRRVATLCGERETAAVATYQRGAEWQTHIMERANRTEAALILCAGAIVLIVRDRRWALLAVAAGCVVLFIGFYFR